MGDSEPLQQAKAIASALEQLADQLLPEVIRSARLDDDGRRDLPLVVALHHPPIAIGDAGMDAIRLLDQACLEELLRPHRALRAVLFGHIHQHWQGSWTMRPDVLLLGCPSTLCSFEAVQPCPLGRADDPGGRLLELTPDGAVQHRVLRWGSI